MTTSPTVPSQTAAATRRTAGSGSQRERAPGVWEIRIRVGIDPATGRSRYRSLTFRGAATEADAYRLELAASPAGLTRLAAQVGRPGALPPARRMTVAQLLAFWLEADHPWKPSTFVGYRSNVRALVADPIALERVVDLTPHQLRTTFTRWAAQGASLAVVGGRFRVLRSAVGWAYDERILEAHPLRSMRGPGRTSPRMPLPDHAVHQLIATAELRLLEAPANDDALTRHRAELDLLLVRLAADTGARRGELTALRMSDLQDRTLHIERAVSAGVVTTPKSGHGRTMTVGSSTAALWHSLAADWRTRHAAELGEWVFTADTGHHRRLGAEVLGHRFGVIRDAAGVPDATLHRLRHSVATFLVARGQILQAQARLGHADAATTLREYAHALPLTDQHVADDIDDHLHPVQSEDPAASRCDNDTS